MQTNRLFAVAAWLSVAACSIDVGLFSDGEAIGGSGAGDSTSSTESTSSSQDTTIATTNVTSTSTNVGAGSAQGGSSQGGNGAGGAGPSGPGSGGSPVCTHDVCEEGPALANGCSPCVTSVCNDDPYCCDTNWDYVCTFAVFDVCGTDCNAALPECEDQHSATPGYVETCGQRGDICEIAFNNQTNCNAICNAAGTECERAFNNQNGTLCGHAQTIGCNTNANDAICVCSRGCGAGQPCAEPQVCSGGMCTNG